MKKTSILLIICAASMWGCIGLFVRTLSAAGFNAMELALIRSFPSMVFLGIYLGVLEPKSLRLEKITDLKYFVATGIFAFAIFSWSYSKALGETSLGVAAVLLYTAPCIVMVISTIVFKEKITYKKVLGLLFTFGGCVLAAGLIGSENLVSPLGLFYGLLSGLTYGLYSIFGKIALKKYSPLTLVFYTFLLSSLVFCLLTNPVEIVNELSKDNLWVIALGYAVVTCFLPYITYTKALVHVEAGIASVLATLEPVVAAFVGIFFLNEQGDLFIWLGILLIVIGVVIIGRGEIQSEEVKLKG